MMIAMAMSDPASNGTLPLPKCPSYQRPIAPKTVAFAGRIGSASSAADLKFLHHVQQTLSGISNR
jgi:hypothetical protein